MSLLNREELSAHVRELIGAEYTEVEGEDGSPRFERELYGRFICSVVITGIDTDTDTVLSRVRLTRKNEPREIYEGVYEWSELESKVVPEDVLTGKLNTFNVIARLCIERPEEDGMLFVWGIKSPDEESEEDADIYTKNDIDIIYNIDTDYFSLGIDTDYFFDSDADQKQYAADLLTELKHFMRNTGLDTHVLLSLDEMVNYNLYSEFEDLETLYAAARMILLGYSR